MRKTDRQRARELRFTRSKQNASVWRAERPYKGVRIEIMTSWDYVKYTNRRIPGTRRFYFCLTRVGAPKFGPASSTPDVFLNSSGSYAGGGEYSTRTLARDMAIRAIDDGYPKRP